MTQPATKLETQAYLFGMSADTYASALADDNQVERAWWLRGLADRLVDRKADVMQATDPMYGRCYRNGWNAGGLDPVLGT